MFVLLKAVLAAARVARIYFQGAGLVAAQMLVKHHQKFFALGGWVIRVRTFRVSAFPERRSFLTCECVVAMVQGDR
ncbi:hypothetical protein WS95_04210 [Burkholderia sp. MSMB1826]|nr:hypothetical protein WS95_04210 [Burkholderia sp. MSMB1826]